MKLFLYDEKHEQVLDEMDINNVYEVGRMVNFLKKNKLTNQYIRFIIAKSYEVDYADGERLVIFDFGGN